MATEQAKGIKRPKDESIPRDGEVAANPDDGQERANIEGYRGPDGSKSLGYLKHAPVGDRAGLGSDADDAGRLAQRAGQNSGAGAIDNAELDTDKQRKLDDRETKGREAKNNPK